MSLLISTSLSTSFLKPQDLQRFFRLMKSLLSARFNFSRYRVRLWVINKQNCSHFVSASVWRFFFDNGTKACLFIRIIWCSRIKKFLSATAKSRLAPLTIKGNLNELALINMIYGTSLSA